MTQRRCPTRERLEHYKLGTGPYARARTSPPESRVDAIETLLVWCDAHGAEHLNLRGDGWRGWDFGVRLSDGRVLRVIGDDCATLIQALNVGVAP